MRKALAAFLVPVVVLLALAACTPGDNLHIDDPISGSITDPNFNDLYRFTASANDRLRIRVLRNSGSGDPEVFVRDPAGTQVCHGATTDALLEVASCGPLVAGTHTFTVQDAGHDEPLEYVLYIQRLARGPSSGALSDGQTVSGTITERVRSEVFSWSATDDDLVRVRVRTGTLFQPRLTVTDGNGTAVCGTTGASGFGELTCRLVAGPHWVLVDEARASSFGGGDISFQLHVRRFRNPAGATAISYGQPKAGSIDEKLETDAYSFTAASNDRIRVTVQRPQFDALDPRVAVANPIGTQVCGSTTTGAVLQIDCPQPLVAGPHWVIVDDDDGLATGPYTLTMTKL